MKKTILFITLISLLLNASALFSYPKDAADIEHYAKYLLDPDRNIHQKLALIRMLVTDREPSDEAIDILKKQMLNIKQNTRESLTVYMEILDSLAKWPDNPKIKATLGGLALGGTNFYSPTALNVLYAKNLYPGFIVQGCINILVDSKQIRASIINANTFTSTTQFPDNGVVPLEIRAPGFEDGPPEAFLDANAAKLLINAQLLSLTILEDPRFQGDNIMEAIAYAKESPLAAVRIAAEALEVIKVQQQHADIRDGFHDINARKHLAQRHTYAVLQAFADLNDAKKGKKTPASSYRQTLNYDPYIDPVEIIEIDLDTESARREVIPGLMDIAQGEIADVDLSGATIRAQRFEPGTASSRDIRDVDPAREAVRARIDARTKDARKVKR
ncbi:MAG: hypothetical protein ABIA04_12445 [Pseudomonadota bacterium]